MKKYICILIAIMAIFVSCGKKEEPLELGPDIEWTEKNVEELVGTEIYCSFDSLQDFFSNVAPSYGETSFYGEIVSIGEEPYDNPSVPYGEFIEVGVKEDNAVRVYCESGGYSVGESVYISLLNNYLFFQLFLSRFPLYIFLLRYFVNKAIITLEATDQKSYLGYEEAIKKLDKLYKETVFVTTARVRTTSSYRTYRLNTTGDYSTFDGEITASTNFAKAKYNGEWCKLKANLKMGEGYHFYLYNTEILESEKD